MATKGTKPPLVLWGVADVAEHWAVTENVVRHYLWRARHRGGKSIPLPDVEGRALWHPDSIRSYQRPGQGAGGGHHAAAERRPRRR